MLVFSCSLLLRCENAELHRNVEERSDRPGRDFHNFNTVYKQDKRYQVGMNEVLGKRLGISTA